MKMLRKNNLLILLLIIVFQTVGNNCKAKSSKVNSINENYSDITIGYKSNDSTGVVTITNSQIQQTVISLFPLISQSTIVNNQPFISVGRTTTYLIFQVFSPKGDTTNVAVSLTALGNDLFVASNGKREFHLCKENIHCTTCGFAMDKNKKIIGCYIKKMRKLSGNEPNTFLIND